DGIRDGHVTGVQTCALPISRHRGRPQGHEAPLFVAVDEDTLRRRTQVAALAAHDHGAEVLVPRCAIRRLAIRSAAVIARALGGEIGRASCREEGRWWG